jgi:hypothetical protein
VSSEFPISLQIEVDLNLSEREDETHLRADTNHARLKRADVVAGATVGADLLVEVSNGADEELLGEELRGAPISASVTARPTPAAATPT